MSKKRKNEEENVLSEPIGHYWQRIFDSGECADVLVSVRGKDGCDEILKVSTNYECLSETEVLTIFGRSGTTNGAPLK